MRENSYLGQFFNLYVPVSLIFLVSLVIQNHILLAADISWLLQVGQRFLAGGNYYTDFFEVNPPLSIYLYLPVLLAAKFFSISKILSLYIYVFVIAFISLFTCFYLINKNSFLLNRTKQIIKLTLAFMFMVLPIHEFGQREHLTLMFIMPYFLLTLLKIKNETVGVIGRIFIGFIAGIGFAVKPYFLLVYLSIELYLFCQTQKIKNLLRIESLLVPVTAIVYLASVFILTPEYITKILPFISDIYYETFGFSWFYVLTQPMIRFWLVAMICYGMLRNYIEYKKFADLLYIVATVFLLILIGQRTLWYYHILLSFSFVFLLFVFLISESTRKINQKLAPMSVTTATKFILAIFLAVMTTLFIVVNVITLTVRAVKQTQQKQEVQNSLFDFARTKMKSGPIFFFDHLIINANTFAIRNNIDTASRFPCQWILPEVIEIQKTAPHSVKAAAYTQKARFLIAATTEDFQRWHPTMVFVNLEMKDSKKDNPQFDYIKFFSQDAHFREIWKNYRYLKTIGKYAIFTRISAN